MSSRTNFLVQVAFLLLLLLVLLLQCVGISEPLLFKFILAFFVVLVILGAAK